MARRLALLIIAAYYSAVSGCTAGLLDGPVVSTADFPWALVWYDEFNGSELNTQKWNRLGDGPRREGYWNRSDAYLDGDGHLVLRTRRADDGAVHSGAVDTQGKFEQRYGLWVIRCKFGSEPGHWPAIWLYTKSVESVGEQGRDGTEIDILEKFTTTDVIEHNLHWDGYGADHKLSGREVAIEGISEGFHTFALLWTPENYVFYVDGSETWRTSAGGVSQVPQFISLTDEVADWAGDIDEAVLPDYFLIDWVRVYSARPPSGPATPFDAGTLPIR